MLESQSESPPLPCCRSGPLVLHTAAWLLLLLLPWRTSRSGPRPVGNVAAGGGLLNCGGGGNGGSSSNELLSSWMNSLIWTMLVLWRLLLQLLWDGDLLGSGLRASRLAMPSPPCGRCTEVWPISAAAAAAAAVTVVAVAAGRMGDLGLESMICHEKK